MSGHLASQTSDLVLPNQARGFDPLPDPDPLAHEAWDPYAITSTETSKEAHNCGQRTFWLMYPGSAPHSFTKLCHSWHCYTKTKEATCVERKVAIYEHRMRRNPLFDGWEAVYLLAVPDESHKLIARPDGVLKWQRGAGDFDAVRKLAKRRDVKWLRLPRFEGVGFIFADGDLTAKGSTRPILRLTVEDARELVMTVLRGHDVRGQPSTSANYPYNFSFPRSDSDDDGPKSFLLPGAHPLIIDRDVGAVLRLDAGAMWRAGRPRLRDTSRRRWAAVGGDVEERERGGRRGDGLGDVRRGSRLRALLPGCRRPRLLGEIADTPYLSVGPPTIGPPT